MPRNHVNRTNTVFNVKNIKKGIILVDIETYYYTIDKIILASNKKNNPD